MENKYIIGLSKVPIKDVINTNVEFDAYVTDEFLDKADLVDGAEIGYSFSPFKEKAKQYNKVDADHICALIKNEKDNDWETVCRVLVSGQENESYERLTEDELPEYCYTYVYTDRTIGIVKRGVVGYYPSKIKVTDDMTNEDAERIVKEQNALIGVSENQAAEMTLKSMFGWGDKKEEANEDVHYKVLDMVTDEIHKASKAYTSSEYAESKDGKFIYNIDISGPYTEVIAAMDTVREAVNNSPVPCEVTFNDTEKDGKIYLSCVIKEK